MPDWVQRNTREILLFALGAGAFIHEVLGGAERPFIVAASLALMGLPFFLASDKLVSRKTEEQKKAERAERTASGLEKPDEKANGDGTLRDKVAHERRMQVLRDELRRLEEGK